MTKTAIIIGSGSDIAKAMMPMLRADGYKLVRWQRKARMPKLRKWDLFISFVGTVKPVGLWHETDATEWEYSIKSNLTRPMRLLRYFWPAHNPSASVCFFAGSNPQMIMSGYSAYNTGKMALLKLVEQLDYETPDAKFFALGPGIVLTKIHKPSMEWDNPKLKAAMEEGKTVPMEWIYGTLEWAIEQDKEVIGGRNICVSDLFTDQGVTPDLAQRLRDDPWLFKLRRVE